MDFRLHWCNISGEISVSWTSYPVWDRFSPKRTLKVTVFRGYIDPGSVSRICPETWKTESSFSKFFYWNDGAGVSLSFLQKKMACNLFISHVYQSQSIWGQGEHLHNVCLTINVGCLNYSSSVLRWRNEANVFCLLYERCKSFALSVKLF